MYECRLKKWGNAYFLYLSPSALRADASAPNPRRDTRGRKEQKGRRDRQLSDIPAALAAAQTSQLKKLLELHPSYS